MRFDYCNFFHLNFFFDLIELYLLAKIKLNIKCKVKIGIEINEINFEQIKL